MTLGEYVRRMRDSRGLSQEELAALCGSPINRGWIASIESDTVKDPSNSRLLKLAKGLRVKPEELYAAQGITREARQPNPKSIIEAIRELQALETSLIAVPVLSDANTIMEYVYMSKPQNGHTNFVGVKVKGFSLEPEIREGDIIICDQDAIPEKGNIVYYFDPKDKQPQLAYYSKELSSAIVSVVSDINRKVLKR